MYHAVLIFLDNTLFKCHSIGKTYSYSFETLNLSTK